MGVTTAENREVVSAADQAWRDLRERRIEAADLSVRGQPAQAEDRDAEWAANTPPVAARPPAA